MDEHRKGERDINNKNIQCASKYKYEKDDYRGQNEGENNLWILQRTRVQLKYISTF